MKNIPESNNPPIIFPRQPELKQVLFIIPVFNDWVSFITLLENLDQALNNQGICAEILAVDDASIIPVNDKVYQLNLIAIKWVNVLKLKRNLGHQRAITIGLAYAEANCSADMVVVMDSDGEDTPEDVIRLIYACTEANYAKIVFARRSQRSESWLFKFFYRAYCFSYRLLTGFDIRVGNFSAIPFKMMPRLLAVSEIWNHYAAGILKSKLPHFDIPTRRGYRYHGKSTMNFTSLVIHGLSAISVHGETVGVRLLMVSFGLMGFITTILLTVIGIRLMTNLAIPGWASYVAVALFSVILQVFIISLSFIFLVLIGRNNTSFLPKRDYHHFVLTLEEIFSKT
ncbi:MAG: glycosyltransferase [Snowella sp.]|nr:glycosyltransferase [Snowella sp.]